ncbi:MAG: C40 family peptidase, partial [Betaproteobacteria bacterium]
MSLLLAGLAFLPAGPTRAHQTALAADVVLTALSHLGVPYRFGGSDPRRGFDCSGLVRDVFQQAAALDMPRSAEDMAGLGLRLDRAELAPGDLVFFNTRGRAYSHVGIYVGEG